MRINKKFILSLILLSAFSVPTFALSTNVSLKQGIDAYKESNYIYCLQKMAEVLGEDPSNTLAHYYVGMSNIQLGNQDKGIESYEKVIMLNTNEHLTKLAQKGIAGIPVEAFYEKEEEAQSKELIENAKDKGDKAVSTLKEAKVYRKQIEKIKKDIQDIEKGLALYDEKTGTVKKIPIKTELQKEVEDARIKLKIKGLEQNIHDIEEGYVYYDTKEDRLIRYVPPNELEEEAVNTKLKYNTSKQTLAEEAKPKASSERRQIEYLYKKDGGHFATPASQSVIREIDLDNLKNDFNEDADKNIESMSNNTEDKKKMN